MLFVHCFVKLQHSVAGLQEKLQSQSDRDSETDFNKKIVEIRDLAMEKLEEVGERFMFSFFL